MIKGFVLGKACSTYCGIFESGGLPTDAGINVTTVGKSAEAVRVVVGVVGNSHDCRSWVAAKRRAGIRRGNVVVWGVGK